ncbi:MAG: hypothetical protein COC12_04350 [Rhodobacteraceae bacterium]|nr:MAG: hypothetical protein COC12_04350 [Paracoccaceae bacterium]
MRALVLGGTGAVGREIVQILLSQGIEVFVTSQNGVSHDARVTSIKWNATEQFDPPRQLFEGITKLSVFFCIGIPSSKQLVRDTPIEQFKDLFDTNTLGLVRVYKAIRTSDLEDVSIVAISSDATVSAREKNGPYSASKTALEIVARTIACEENGGKFRINVIAPSLIDSPMARKINILAGETDFRKVINRLPQGRAISPKEVALAAVDIATASQWSYANGQVFRLSSAPR